MPFPPPPCHQGSVGQPGRRRFVAPPPPSGPARYRHSVEGLGKNKPTQADYGKLKRWGIASPGRGGSRNARHLSRSRQHRPRPRQPLPSCSPCWSRAAPEAASRSSASRSISAVADEIDAYGRLLRLEAQPQRADEMAADAAKLRQTERERREAEISTSSFSSPPCGNNKPARLGVDISSETSSQLKFFNISIKKRALKPISISSPSYWQLKRSCASFAKSISSDDIFSSLPFIFKPYLVGGFIGINSNPA